MPRSTPTSTPMPASALVPPAVSAFAAAVRAALSDLAPDEVDELTDGLEADLTDRMAELHDADPDATDPATAELGDPVAYAEELRAAAGMPHRTPRRGFAVDLAELRHAPAVVASAFREFAAAHPFVERVGGFLRAVRPLWWVFRATVVTALIVNVTRPGWWSPINGMTVLVGVAALVVSVQFGRGKWLPFAWMRGMLLALNVVLAVCAPVIVAVAVTAVNNAWYSTTYADESTGDLSTSGLMENGNPVSNIFAYDAQGNPLRNVQLFDQDGKPLNLMADPNAGYGYADGDAISVPSNAVVGRPGWNVFPLDHVTQSSISDDGTIKPNAHRLPAELPFATAQPLARDAASPAPTASPAPSASAPSASGPSASGPSASPAPTASPAP